METTQTQDVCTTVIQNDGDGNMVKKTLLGIIGDIIETGAPVELNHVTSTNNDGSKTDFTKQIGRALAMVGVMILSSTLPDGTPLSVYAEAFVDKLNDEGEVDPDIIALCDEA